MSIMIDKDVMIRDLAKEVISNPYERPRWVYAIEEMSELTKELMKMVRCDKEISYDSIIEEGCDTILTVYMLLNSLYCTDDEIKDRMINKLKRTVDELKDRNKKYNFSTPKMSNNDYIYLHKISKEDE